MVKKPSYTTIPVKKSDEEIYLYSTSVQFFVNKNWKSLRAVYESYVLAYHVTWRRLRSILIGPDWALPMLIGPDWASGPGWAETEFLNFLGAQESIPRNQFRQAV